MHIFRRYLLWMKISKLICVETPLQNLTIINLFKATTIIFTSAERSINKILAWLVKRKRQSFGMSIFSCKFQRISEKSLKESKYDENSKSHDRILVIGQIGICTRSKPNENLALKITCSICQAILTSKMLNLWTG